MTLRLQPEAVYAGASPHAADPVIVVHLDLTATDAEAGRALETGMRVLREAFPEWLPAASSAHPTLAQGLGQSATGWALAALNEVRGFLHAAGAEATDSGVRLWLGYHHPGVSLAALELALELIQQAGGAGKIERAAVAERLESLWRRCRRYHPDSESHILMQAARSHDIPVSRLLPEANYWQYGWGARARIFFEALSDADSFIGQRLQHSKATGKALLARLGFPTPDYVLVSETTELPGAAARIGWPCVVKPLAMGGGKGITAGIDNFAALELAFAQAREYATRAGEVMVERHVPGDDHRLLVIDGRFFAAIRREPPAVVGDGASSVGDLLDRLNGSRSLNLVRSGYLRPVVADAHLLEHLRQHGLDLATVPDAGRRIVLRSNANWSTGGHATDVTSRVHPHLRQMAEALAGTLRLAAFALDFITTDIGKSWQEEGGVIEFNSTPGLSVMAAGGIDPVTLGTAILGERPARIPLQLVLFPGGEIEAARDRARWCSWPSGVGWACGGEALIDRLPLGCGSGDPWAGFQALIRHRAVARIIVLATVDDIVRHGLPADKVDQIAFCDCEPGLPDTWARLLREASHSVASFADWDDFVASLS